MEEKLDKRIQKFVADLEKGGLILGASVVPKHNRVEITLKTSDNLGAKLKTYQETQETIAEIKHEIEILENED